MDFSSLLKGSDISVEYFKYIIIMQKGLCL